MASDGYTTIARTIDPAHGELVAELLRREGIAVRFHRVSSTLIGLPEMMVEMTVDVPVEAEARARELLADLEYVGAAQEAGEGGDEDDEEEDDDDERVAREPAGGAAARPIRARRPALAAGFAVFLPGGAHLYARRPWTALVIAVGLAVSFALLVVAAREKVVPEIATAVIIAIVACDAIAGVRATRAERDGKHLSRGGQVARGLLLLLLGATVGSGVRVAAEAPRMLRDWRFVKYGSQYKISCTARSIVVENHGREAREIEIGEPELVQSYLWNRSDRQNIMIVGPRFQTVAPGGRAAVAVELPESVARECNFPGTPRRVQIGMDTSGQLVTLGGLGQDAIGCHFSFGFAARRLDGVDDAPFVAEGSCNPSSKTGGEVAGSLEPPHQETPKDQD